jgi:hypothetical protein
MARRLIQYYEFTPGGAGVGTVRLGRPYSLNEILMITNVTTNTVIYNFGDPQRGATLALQEPPTTGIFRAANQRVTLLTLDFATTGMNANDQLQIYVEETEQRTRPYDFGLDAVERQRIGIPRSLIDADFEYGLQQTKWASLSNYRHYPTSFEIPGTPITANLIGYSTIITSGSSANIGNINAGTSLAVGNIALNLANQGQNYLISGVPNSGIGVFTSNTAPVHNWNDYKIIINQGLAGEADCPQTPVGAATSGGGVSVITLPQPITLANGGQFQRSFTVANTTGFFAGDIIAVAGLPDGVGHAALTTAIMTATTFNLNANAVIAANSVIAVETAGAGAGVNNYVWELMAVHTSAIGVHGVTRHLWGTNPGNATINSGAKIMYLSGNAAVGLREAAIEIMRVDAVDSTTRQLHVTRSWFNTNANVQFNTNSIVSVVNLRGNIFANAEIVKHIQPLTTQNSTSTFQRGFGAAQGQIGFGFGTSPVSKASTGSHVITMTGVTVTGNASVPIVVINANSHQVPRQSAANANVQISTIGLTNPNIEGVYTNRINDLNYIAYYPKVGPGPVIPIPAAMVNLNDFSLEIRRGGQYTGGNIRFNAITSNAGTPSLITVSAVNPHGLLPGAAIDVSLVGGTNADTHGSGIMIVETVPTERTFTYTAKPGAAVPNTITNANLLAFSSAIVRHRPLDGGTNIGANLPVHGYETARQTRKYFRYQSGKGMMFTTGTQFNPVFTIRNVAATGTSIGSTIFVTTETEHGVQAGANVSLYNIGTSGYSTFYRVAGITSPFTFTVNAVSVLGDVRPVFLGNSGGTTPPRAVVRNWHGARVRSGMFDSANGVYWEYDGQQLYAVRRSATNNLAGLVNVGRDDNRVSGDVSTSRFVDQVKAGDLVYIKGMVYAVTQVQDQNTLFINPGFKGVINAQDAAISVVRELRTPAPAFNLDKLDGSGPSSYIVDLTKMQMVAIQYTWYGAGFIDYGLRTNEGRMIWAHRYTNNNKYDEAYMRSGNLPARYQASNTGAVGQLKLAMTAAATELQLYGVDEFPTDVNVAYPGHVVVDNELISFTGVNTSTGNLTGLTRAATLRSFVLGANRAFTMGSATTHNVNAGVILYSITAAPDLNHWGSAVILDGDFDVDRTYQFNYQVTNVAINQLNPFTLFMMRLAPSITSALAGDLGVKDIINRAQLLLQNCYITLANTQARCLLQGIANPENVRAANWQRLNLPVTFNQPSFTQFVANTGFGTAAQTIQFGNIRATQTTTGTAGADVITPWAAGGEQLFAIPIIGTNSGFVDLSKVKEIGGPILPGIGTYPNGPEIVAFNIVPVGDVFNSRVELQVTFLESQA